MYGSIHTHFESQFDTGNVLAEMITAFYRKGAKKIAVTEHGVFSSFEDLKDTLHYLQTDPKKVKEWQEAGLDVESIPEDYDMEIIPGIEGYFSWNEKDAEKENTEDTSEEREKEASHLILVAKDYIGYEYLCKIISESNENLSKTGKPIITLKNLQANIKEQGHLICTSACIAGPFGRRLGLKQINLESDIKKLESELTASGFLNLSEFETFYEEEKKRLRQIKPTKAMETAANKLLKKSGDDTALRELEEKRQESETLTNWLEENEEKYNLTKKQLQVMKKAIWVRKVAKLDTKKQELSEWMGKINQGEIELECFDLLQNFIDIFGENNFYFELQNHFLESEKKVYNNLLHFAYRTGFTNFIASNDIHIGFDKNSPRYDIALKRRNVAKFLRYGSYYPETEDDREYTIKDDNELIQLLADELEDFEGPLERVYSKDIAEKAVNNIQTALEQCHVEFPKDKKYYPKFCDDENAEFEKKVREGIKQRFPDGFPDGRYEKRLEYELNVIKTMGYAGYHLIVADYLTYGRLLGYLPTQEEVEKAPFSIDALDKYITEKGYPRIGYSIGPGRGCGKKGTMVYTENGVKEIENIKVGDFIYDCSGKLCPVLKVWEYPVNEEMLEITVWNGGKLTYTKEHKFLSASNIPVTSKERLAQGYKYLDSKPETPFEWKKAESLQIGDWVTLPDFEKQNVCNDVVFDLGQYANKSNNVSVTENGNIYMRIEDIKPVQYEGIVYDLAVDTQNEPSYCTDVCVVHNSAVGSLCCYLMGITDIDPIPYNLLFERFLNVERVSMPDIDSDFKCDIRAKVEDYCRAKYGSECICKIMTKSYGATKGNLRLAARYYGTIAYEEKYGKLSEMDDSVQNAQSFEELEKVLENADPKYKDFMKSWYDKADKLAKAFDNDGVLDSNAYPETEQHIIKLANSLEGLFTGYGQHAAGTIISSTDVTNVIPLMWNKKKGAMETQCTMAQAEAKGLLKMDFLGLQNLDIITNIIQKPWRKMDQDGLLQDYKRRDEMLKDFRIYRDIFWTGLTQGVFQFESDGMKKMLMDFKPETFEDIILLVAAYRPGPLQYLPEIIQQKQYTDQQMGKDWASVDKIGKIDKPKHSIDIDNKDLNDILNPTYGCIIYQEQVMQIFQNLAGYSLGGADLVRRAMSKKKTAALEKERIAFIHGDAERNIDGCIKKQGISEKDANNLFNQMMEFAKYAFNKSHATAYAMVAMFTAYCKEYHTADFYRYSLDATKELKEVPAFLREMPKFGIEIKAPSMMDSENNFSVEDDGRSIRFSFKRIKGFSEQNITRNTTVQDFIKLNPDISLKTIESYAKLGFFKEAWSNDRYISRVQGNRHEIIRWITTVGENYKKYLAIINKMNEELDTLELAHIKLAKLDLNTPEGLAYAKEVQNLEKQYDKDKGKRADLASILNQRYLEDKVNYIHIKETEAQILENRAWEVEMLSTPFDIENSKLRLQQCKNQLTFDALEKSISENNGNNTIYIPAIVLSVSEPKKTKSSGKLYYDVTLMDKTGAIIVRRFDTPPDVLDGEFKLTLNEVKYYLCYMNAYKPLRQQEKRETIPFWEANERAIIAAVKSNGIQKYQIPGNKNVKMIELEDPSMSQELTK